MNIFVAIGGGLTLVASGSQIRGTAPCCNLVPEGGGGVRSKNVIFGLSTPENPRVQIFMAIGGGLTLVASGSRTRGTAPCSTLVPEGEC